MTTDTITDQIISLYVGYFNRAPDPEGLNYWISEVNNGKMSITGIADNFAKSGESMGLYAYLRAPNLVNVGDFLDEVYQNLFNRAPDAEGKAYWAGQLTNGAVSTGQAILAIINGAKEGGDDAKTIANKITVSQFYVAQTLEKNNNWSVDDDLNDAIAVLNGVTADASTVDTGKATVTQVAQADAQQQARGNTVALTDGADSPAGSAKGDTFIAADASSAQTLTVGDTLDGGAGVDTLKIVTEKAITGSPAGVTVTNIENLDILSTSSVNFDTSEGYTGLTSIQSTSSGGATLSAAATTDVTLTDNAQAFANLSVQGGKDISLTAKGAAGGTIAVGDTTAVSGSVSITREGSYNDTDVTLGAINITGGTSISVTSTVGITDAQQLAAKTNASNHTVTTEAINITGGAATTDVTIKGDAAAVHADAVTRATESTTIWFPNDFRPSGSESLTIAGLTLETSEALYREQLRAFFASQAEGSTGGTLPSGATASGTLTGWSSSAASGKYITFTSTTEYTNVPDLPRSTTSVNSINNVIAASSTTQGAPESIEGGIGITNGDVNINDANAASTTDAGTITTVTLENFGAATVNSSALTTLNLQGTATSLDASTLGALTTPTNNTLALNANGLTSTGAVSIDDDISTLNIDASTAASSVASLVANGATAITVTGDAQFTATANTLNALETITVSNSAGAAFGTQLGADVLFTGGAGADSVWLGATTKEINMGAGDDTVTISAMPATGGKIEGGEGSDTLIVHTLDSNISGNAAITGFETLRVAGNASGSSSQGEHNAAGFTALEVGALSGNTVFVDVATDVGLTIDTAQTQIIQVDLDNHMGDSDVFALNLESDAMLTAGTVIIKNVETINIANIDTNTDSANANTLTLEASSVKTVNITGSAGLQLTGNTIDDITSLDASGVTLANETDTGLTFTSSNTTAAEAVSITGTNGVDVLTGTTNATDTLIGGAGADTLVYTGGADIFTGGTGNDVFDVDATGTKAAHLSITDASAGDRVDFVGASNGAFDMAAAAAQTTLTAGSTLDAYLNAAADQDGSTNSVFEWFQFEGNTYAVISNDNTGDFTEGTDAFVQLSGAVDLSNSAISEGVLTIV